MNKRVKCEEPCDGRLSSTVPREGRVKFPPLTRHQYRYDFILDAVVDENRILTSYNNNDGYLIFKCKLK